jgi:pimeloyl-ACP methyl ester carboxylesterase
MAEGNTLPVGLDEGVGGSLVLIPGYGTQPDTYQPLVRLLAQRCRVVLLDIYGIRGPWRYDSVLRSFAATLGWLGLDQATFLGHSFGGGIELGFAVRHPERVVELVFSDTLAVSREWVLAREAFSHPWRMLGMATPRAASDFTRSWIEHPRQLVDAAWWGFTSGRSKDIRIVARERLPAYVLWANRDSLLSRQDGMEFARELDASFTVADAPGYVDHDWMYRHPHLFVKHLDQLGLRVLSSGN